jgi:hypothetical protein
VFVIIALKTVLVHKLSNHGESGPELQFRALNGLSAVERDCRIQHDQFTSSWPAEIEGGKPFPGFCPLKIASAFLSLKLLILVNV